MTENKQYNINILTVIIISFICSFISIGLTLTCLYFVGALNIKRNNNNIRSQSLINVDSVH